MKKHFLVLIAVVAAIAGLGACTSFDEPLPQNTLGDTHEAPLTISRTPEEAKACALEAFSTFYGASRALRPLKNVKCFTSPNMSRSGSTDTLFYVVNTEDNGGYAVIAADRSTDPVLAVTENGSIESLDSIDNPGAQIFFDELMTLSLGEPRPGFKKDSISTIQPNPWWPGGDVNPYPNTPQYKDVLKKSEWEKEPRAPFAWGQSMPEGMYCKNGIAGCVNVACALIGSYFEEPTNIPKYMNSIDWSLIKQHQSSLFFGEYDNCGLDTEALPHKELAKVCHAFALANNSKFKDNSTGATLSNARETLSKQLTVSKIQKGMPNGCEILGDGIIMVGAKDSEKGSRHAFIIDGCFRKISTLITYQRNPGESMWFEINRRVTCLDYNHINWGWCGMDNGYFYEGVFNTDKAKEYDNNYHNSELQYNFNSDFKYFVVSK